MTRISDGTTRWRKRPRWLFAVVMSLVLLALVVFLAQPIRVRYQLGQGIKALEAEKYAEALAHFEKAKAIDSKSAQTRFWLARASRKRGDLEGVRSNLDEARRLGYADPQRLRHEWWILLAESGRISDAEPHLKEMLLNAGDDGGEICEAFTKGYCLSLRFSEARKILSAWEADLPNDFRPHLLSGQIHAGDEKYSLAEEEFRKAFQRAPDHRLVRRELARALFKTDKYKEAEQILRKLIDEDPADVQSLMILAQISQDRKDYSESLAYVQRMIDIQPQDFSARLMRAKLLLASGDPSQAVATAESLAQIWPDDLNLQYVLAQSLRAAGRNEEAARHFVLHGELQKNSIRIEELTRDAKKRPTDPEVRYELGLLLLRHVSRTEGVSWLQSVFQYAPAHRGAHQALAEYYTKVGNLELAQQHQLIVDRAPTDSPRHSPGSPHEGDHTE